MVTLDINCQYSDLTWLYSFAFLLFQSCVRARMLRLDMVRTVAVNRNCSSSDPDLFAINCAGIEGTSAPVGIETEDTGEDSRGIYSVVYPYMCVICSSLHLSSDNRLIPYSVDYSIWATAFLPKGETDTDG